MRTACLFVAALCVACAGGCRRAPAAESDLEQRMSAAHKVLRDAAWRQAGAEGMPERLSEED
jgi:hypothetical protein